MFISFFFFFFFKQKTAYEMAQCDWSSDVCSSDLPDKVTAYMWHLLAEFAGETRSRIARSQLDPTMTADQKSEANARASQWLRRHRQSSDRVSLPARQM